MNLVIEPTLLSEALCSVRKMENIRPYSGIPPPFSGCDSWRVNGRYQKLLLILRKENFRVK